MLDAGPLGRTVRSKRGGCGRGQIPRGTAGDQRTQQRVELVDRTDPGLRQIDPTLVEHGHSVGAAFGFQGSGVALQRGDTRRCGGIDAVVLAAASARQLPHPGGRGGGHVDDGLAAGQQPRGEVSAESLGVLDRPPALRPLRAHVSIRR